MLNLTEAFSNGISQDEHAEPTTRMPHLISAAYGKHLQVHLSKLTSEAWLGTAAYRSFILTLSLSPQMNYLFFFMCGQRMVPHS